jgi:hypothetical protein
MRYGSLQERLLSLSAMEPGTGCWLWLGKRKPLGYGRLNVRRAGKHITLLAHRASYELFKEAPIGKGKELDHICHQPACINPEHLREVSGAENLANRRRYKSYA